MPGRGELSTIVTTTISKSGADSLTCCSRHFLIAFFEGQTTLDCKPPESRLSSSPIEIRNLRTVTSLSLQRQIGLTTSTHPGTMGRRIETRVRQRRVSHEERSNNLHHLTTKTENRDRETGKTLTVTGGARAPYVGARKDARGNCLRRLFAAFAPLITLSPIKRRARLNAAKFVHLAR
ncbi:hypothetical protein EVAR_63778_1 [Eumeta japonica]|uniref:Uncharacterized protein n=1 Tax=Eumeta variegata TaxID=151549 RepID=A0A4C1ZIB6_EUMVA|nr:hypothetical protein EVAR_63778_1 [Eumeta japonica]